MKVEKKEKQIVTQKERSEKKECVLRELSAFAYILIQISVKNTKFQVLFLSTEIPIYFS